MSNTKLQQLTKAIQSVVPDIMRLKFGCKIITTYPLLDEHIENKHIEHIIISSEIDKYNLKRYIIAFKNKLSITAEIGREDIKEIIGRPISLEDCLIALSKELLEKYIDIKWSANYIVLIDNRLDNVGGDDRCIWVINKPLHQQEQETIDFLWDLIVKK